MKVFTPAEKTLMAMVALERDEDFVEVMTYLEANEIYLAKLACKMPEERGSALCQGGSATITSFIGQVSEARESLEKLRSKEAKKQK